MERKRFDFFILSLGRVATQAIWRFVDAHPSVCIPSFYNTDELLRNRLDDVVYELGVGYKKRGLILHDDAIAWNDEDTLPRLKKMMANDLMIQMVREPISHLTSIYNHRVSRNTIMKRPLPTLDLAFFLDEAILQYGKFYNIGERYKSYFNRWQVVDFSDMDSDSVGSTMSNIFSQLQVEAFCGDDLYQLKLQNDTAFFMRKIEYRAKINEFNLTLRLHYDGHPEIEHPELIHIASYPSLYGQVSFPIEDRKILVSADKAEWEAIPTKLREGIHRNGDLAKMVDGYVQQWISSVNKFELKIAKHRISAIPENLVDKIKVALGDDVGMMLKHHPVLEHAWQGW